MLPGVIISEKKDESIRKHQASTLPFPYTSVSDMEAVLAQPIGREWLPHQVCFCNFVSSEILNTQAHNSLIQRQVRVVPGKIIQPMNKEEVRIYYLYENELFLLLQALRQKAKRNAREHRLVDSVKK